MVLFYRELDYVIYLAQRPTFYFAQRAQRPRSFLLIVVIDKYRLIRDADLSRVEAFSIFNFQFSILFRTEGAETAEFFVDRGSR